MKTSVHRAKLEAYIQFGEPDISDYRIDGEHMGFHMLAEFVNKSFGEARLNPNPGHCSRSWLE